MTIDFTVHVAPMPDISVFELADPSRERQDDPWLDLLMARRTHDPWLVWVGDRHADIPRVRLPSPEEEAREARGGLEAPCTRVGLIYAGRLRAHMQVHAVVRHVQGTYLLLTNWRRFFPVTVRQDLPWFAGWRDVSWDKKDLLVSERWAIDGLAPELAARVKALLALPLPERPKATQATKYELPDIRPKEEQQERIVMGAPSNCTPFRIEGGSADGATGIICSRGGRAKMQPCVACGKLGGLLCDAMLGTTKKTCSAPLCDTCATKDGKRDLCPKHASDNNVVAAKQQPAKAAGQLGFF
jgi:hypothetical protein